MYTMLKFSHSFNVTALRVPEADKDIMSILGRDFSSREDENLQGVQTTIVSAAIPTVSLLADLVKQVFTGQLDELAPAQEAIWIPWQSLVLIGNTASLSSFKARAGVIAVVKPKRPKLVSFLEVLCKKKS